MSRRVIGLIAAAYLLAFMSLLPGLHTCESHAGEEKDHQGCCTCAVHHAETADGPSAQSADSMSRSGIHGCVACTFLSQAPLYVVTSARVFAPREHPHPAQCGARRVPPLRFLLSCLLPRGPPCLDPL